MMGLFFLNIYVHRGEIILGNNDVITVISLMSLFPHQRKDYVKYWSFYFPTST